MASGSELIMCFDLDGVLADIEPEMDKRIQEHFGVKQTSPHEFLMEDRYGIPKKEMETFVRSDQMFEDPGFWLSAKPFHMNINKINKWYNGLYAKRIFIVTGRHNEVREATEQWLIKNGVPYDAVFMETKDNKVEVMKYVDADFIVEDRHEECWAIAKRKRKAYLLQKHYNEHHKNRVVQGRFADNIIWINSFLDIEMKEGING